MTTSKALRMVSDCLENCVTALEEARDLLATCNGLEDVDLLTLRLEKLIDPTVLVSHYARRLYQRAEN